MPKDLDTEDPFDSLRARAEEIVSGSDLSETSRENLQHLLHELQVHQIELKLQYEELLSVQGELSDMYEFAPVGYITIDRHGLIRRTNDTFESLIGLQRYEIVGRAMVNFIRKDCYKQYFIFHRELSDPNRTVSQELWMCRKDGSEFPALFSSRPVLSLSGEIERYRIAVLDQSEKWTAEKELLEKKRFLASVLETMPFMLFIYEVSSQRIIFTNPEFRQTTGATLTHIDEDDGHLLPSLLPQGDAAMVQQSLASMPDDDPNYSMELCFKMRNTAGDWLDIHLHARTFLLNHEGKPEQILCIGEDASESLRLQADLQHSEKLRAIGELAGGIAHDFNNNLTSIIGFTQMLRDALKENREATKYTEIVLRASKRSAELTKQLLAFARKGKVQTRRISLHDLLSDVIALLERALMKTMRLSQNFSASNDFVDGDGAQLQSAFLNIALNARDATPQGGKIHIETDLVRPSSAEPETEESDTEYIRVRITDTGAGMDEKTKKRIFDPFFTTKAKGEGTGMGLPAVFGIVESHGGMIDVESTPGTGTTFSIQLPLSTEVGPERAQTRKIHKPQQSCTILAIDDEADVRDLFQRVLGETSYEIHTACCMKRAREGLLSRHAPIDLVILDVYLPDTSFATALAEVRQTHPECKVLIVSGLGGSDEIHTALKAPGTYFLAKPFDCEMLLAEIAKIMR